MYRGFIKLHRKIADNPIWSLKPFSSGQAWVDLLLIANHKKGLIEKRGNKIIVERGQVGYSVKGLSDRWGWSRGKVERFLKYLENEHQIEQQKSNITTLITLLNYEEFNHTDTKIDSRQTPDGQQTDTNKNGKNEKKEPIVHFETFWSAFADKRGKEPALRAWQKIKPDEQLAQEIIKGAEKYAEQRSNITAKNGTPKMAQGWLTDKRWEDEDTASGEELTPQQRQIAKTGTAY